MDGNLYQQILANLNWHSALDILKRGKLPHVVRSIATGIGVMDEEAFDNQMHFRGELTGTYEHWNLSGLVPRLSLSRNTIDVFPYRIAAEICANIGMHYAQGDLNVIAGPTASGHLWLNNGIEVNHPLGYDESCRIDDCKGGLYIIPDGGIGVFLPGELDALTQSAPQNSVFVGTSLSFEVPLMEIDSMEAVEYADWVINFQGYLESYAGSRGFISISPDGQMGYTVFRGNQTGVGVFPKHKNTGESVLAMLQIFPAGTRLCALEEGMTALPFHKENTEMEEYLPLYFYTAI